MRPTRQDWKDLCALMPGVAPAGQAPWETGALYSVERCEDGCWSLHRGYVLRVSRERTFQRVETQRKDTALVILLELKAVGFDLPLFEQLTGELTLPTPRDLYFSACCQRLPGRFLKVTRDGVRIGLSLTMARRQGWKIMFFEEPAENELFCRDYLTAQVRGEWPAVFVLGRWNETSIGNRRGIIKDADLEHTLALFEIDLGDVLGLGQENEGSNTPSR